MGVSVNWVDIAVVVLMLVGISAGLFQGMIRQALFGVAAYVGVVLAAQYHQFVASFIESVFPAAEPTILSLTAMAIVFVVTCAVLNVLAYGLYHSTALPEVAFLDHLGGAMLGALSTWVIISFSLGILYFSLDIPWPGWEGVQQGLEAAADTSLFRPSVQATLPLLSQAVKPWLPAGLPAILSM